MNLVAFDTSTEACSVAVQVGDEVRVDHRLVQREHAARLLPMMQQLLSDFELKPNQLDGVVYGRGPGSFTGVRIAASAAQGLALAANCGVYGVSSLHAMASACERARSNAGKSADCIMASIDARMNQIYTNFYRIDLSSSSQASGALLEVGSECVTDPEHSALPLSSERIDGVPSISSIVLCGTGAQMYEEKIRSALSAALKPANVGSPDPATDSSYKCELEASIELQMDVFPEAQDLLRLAPRSNDKRWLSPEFAQPIYLRNNVALTLAERSSR